MQAYNPNSFAPSLPTAHRQWAQSVTNAVNGSLDLGTPKGNTPTDSGTYGINAGVYSQFTRGNGSGVLIRIAANGLAGTGASYNWGASNAGVVINHGLRRQPIGFHVVDQDKAATIYRTAAPDLNQITLAPTDNTASVTVYVF